MKPTHRYDDPRICRRNSVIEISEVHTVDDEIVGAFGTLIPQLSRSNPAPDMATLQAIADSEASTLLIARDDELGDLIVGSMTLAMFRIPTGLRAWIEDVVVDERARGKGVGSLLNERALQIAKSAGAKTVDLTSRPSREAANRLYQRLGFVVRETNVYRFTDE
jgi:ribosomal protein S18 acetylase RimI-like enzyme